MTTKPIEIFRQSWQQIIVMAGSVLAFGYASIWMSQKLFFAPTTIPIWLVPAFILLTLVCLCFTAIALLYFVKCICTKYAFYENDAIFTIPNWKGFFPLFPYRKLYLSYDEIKTVERRSEVYSWKGTPLFAPYATSIFTADQEQQTINYDPRLKWFQGLDKNFAYQLARKSGRPLADQGTVGPHSLKDMLSNGAAPWKETPIAPQDLRAIKQALRRNQIIGVFTIGGLIALVFFNI